MLLDSHRLKPGDREHWSHMERLDAKWAKTIAFSKKIARARQALEYFFHVHEGMGYCGVSWGKDSVVVAHLCDGRWPLVWVRVVGMENPDCERVRDTFGRPSETIDISPRVDGDGTLHASGTLERGFASAVCRYGRPYISGVRADESAMRKLRHQKWGENSTNTCAPLSTWTGEDVFAYLRLFDLPVHPAYAMTMAGRLERNRIRVASIGGERGTGVGRREWERTYYPEMFERSCTDET